MTVLQHGGQLQTMVKRFGGVKEDWVDVSTGISPYTYPIALPPVESWQRLPEVSEQFTDAAGAYYGSELGLPIPGSQSVIQLLPQLCAQNGKTIGRVWLPRVGYKEHQKAWQGTAIPMYFYNDLPALSALTSNDMVVVINPNNPTGFMANQEQLFALANRLEQLSGMLIIDEAFMDCTPAHSMLTRPLLANMFILRSTGKFFGLAGIRLGMLFAQKQWLHHCAALLGPWTVNGPALHIAAQAFSDRVWQQQQRAKLDQDSTWLDNVLSEHLQIRSAGTALFRTIKTPHATRWFSHLCQHQIYVRLCDEKDALRFGLPLISQRRKLENAIASLPLLRE
ncbi:threonine-phosphate decarboxylase CobD [Alteromonas sp. C1M14]|uniref:threonine-phosphate decarboxylase CobD n=1 Tax=Alteromonas sp. C1M14 TaxID=2841567 RepID=UPI001C0819F6|nr:threonine-phosphate decarboxylase CobD [Alteromonas sp. C1M14]MBU2979626.1 threonine-phosphate decarboxylase CobD [Alteromonas sp. C1M14]